MNKKTIKIAGWALGLSMAVAGIGVIAGSASLIQPSLTTEVKAEDEVYKTISFGSSYNSQGVSSYSSSWYATNNGFRVDIENFNNNNNGWNYIKCGSKSAASVGKVTTAAALDKTITKVGVVIDSITAASVNSIKLFTSVDGSSWSEAGSFAKDTGEKQVALASPAANLYYKIEFDCKKSSNGVVQVSQVKYYQEAAKAQTINGSATFVGEMLDNASLALTTNSESATWSITAGSDLVELTGANPAKSITVTGKNGGIGTATITATAAGYTTATATITIKDASATYSVTYSGNDNTSGSAPIDDNDYAYNAKAVVLGNTGNLTKEGYVFAGWNTTAEGDGTDYTAGDTFDITANTTLYAKWVEEDSIVVKSASVDIKVGQAYDLTENLTLTGVGSLTFSIADDTYATLDGNILTGKAKGDVIVTARKGSLDPVNFTVQVDNADPGTQYNPYTVSDAVKASIGDDVYVVGYISTITDISTQYGNATFNISDDGTTENELCAFRGLYLNGAAITNDNKDRYALGSKVVLHGQIAEHNGQKELGQGNVLVAIENPVLTAVTVSLADANRKFYNGGTQQSKIKASDFIVSKFSQFSKPLGSLNNGSGYSISVRKNGVQQGNLLTGTTGVELFENAEPTSPSVTWTAVAIVNEVESEPIEITVLAKAPETLTATYSGKTEFYEKIDAPVTLSSENVGLSLTNNDGSSSSSYDAVNPLCDIVYTIGETPVDINDYIDDGQFNVAEDTTFTVTYSTKAAPSVKDSFDFTVYNFTGLTAADATERTYYAKETYALSYVVTAHYGARTKILTEDQYEADITEMTPSSKGKVTATIDAGILGTTTVDFNVNPEIALVSTSVTAPTKSDYKFGEAFDSAGLNVLAEYSDSNINDVTDQAVLSSYDPYKLGTQTITVSFKGDVIDSFEVTNTFVGASVTNPAIDAQGSGFSSSAEVTDWSWNGEGSDYAAGNAPYLLKMDSTGDTITYRLPNNAFTKAASISAELYVKKIGGASNSTFTVSALDSEGNIIPTNQIAHVNTNAADGAQNATHTLSATLNNPNGVEIYGVRFSFNKGSNIGVSGGRVQATATKNEALIAQQAPAMLEYLSQFKTCPSGWTDRSDIERLVAEYNAMHDDAKDAFELLTLTDYDWENIDEYDVSNHSYTGGNASRDGIKAIDKLKEMVSQYNNSLEQGESQLVLETPSGNFAVLPKNPNVGAFADVGNTGVVLFASTAAASLIAAGFILLRKRKEDR